MSPKKSQPKIDGTKKHHGHMAKAIKVPAIPIVQGPHTLYIFTEKASVLYNALSINRRAQAKEKDEGYQRVLSLSRVQAITRYLRARKTIPGSIIVNLDKATFDDKRSELTIPSGNDVGWVIDGQHRLAGAAMAARGDGGAVALDVDLAVIAFVGLDKALQIEQFVTINREAKNVPTSLYIDLLKHLPTKNAADAVKERANDLATELRRDDNSPFFERIAVVSAPKAGQISNVNFARKISTHIAKNGVLSSFTERDQIRIVSNYYQGLRNVFPEQFDDKESVFFKTLGFGALWNVFPTVFSLALKEHKGFTVKDVAAVFKRIENMDFSNWAQYGSGDQAERMAGEDCELPWRSPFGKAMGSPLPSSSSYDGERHRGDRERDWPTVVAGHQDLVDGTSATLRSPWRKT